MTACFLILLSAALIRMATQPVTHSLSGLLAGVVLISDSVTLLGYLYGTPLLYSGALVQLALSTALALALMSGTIIAPAGPEAYPLRWFSGSSVQARLLRTFLPVSFLTVLIDGIIFRLASPLNPALRSAIAAMTAIPITNTGTDPVTRRD